MHNNHENAAHSQEEPLKIRTPKAEHEQSSADESKTASTPRSSNMRSRWKRKGAAAAKPAGSSQSKACGEVDPSSVRETLTTHRREKTLAKEVHHSDALSDRAEKPARSSHDHAESVATSHKASAHTPKDDEVFQAPRLHTRHRSQDREKPSADAPRGPNERSDRPSRERSDRYERPVASRASQARPSMAPASYRPTAVKPDSLWVRVKDFFGNMFGHSSASKPSTPMASRGDNSRGGRSGNSYGRRPMAGKNPGRPGRRSEGGRSEGGRSRSS